MDEQAVSPSADAQMTPSGKVGRCFMRISSNKLEKKRTLQMCPVRSAATCQAPKDRALLGKERPKAEISAV